MKGIAIQWLTSKFSEFSDRGNRYAPKEELPPDLILETWKELTENINASYVGMTVELGRCDP